MQPTDPTARAHAALVTTLYDGAELTAAERFAIRTILENLAVAAELLAEQHAQDDAYGHGVLTSVLDARATALHRLDTEMAR